MVFVHEYHKSLCRKTAKIIGLRRVVEYSEHYKIARSIISMHALYSGRKSSSIIISRRMRN